MVDGPEKIAGKALYTSDFYDPSALAGAIEIDRGARWDCLRRHVCG